MSFIQENDNSAEGKNVEDYASKEDGPQYLLSEQEAKHNFVEKESKRAGQQHEHTGRRELRHLLLLHSACRTSIDATNTTSSC